MKKIIVTLLMAALMVLSVIAAKNPGPIDQPKLDPTNSHYDRTDIPCMMIAKEKTLCHAGGMELCSPRYCQ